MRGSLKKKLAGQANANCERISPCSLSNRTPVLDHNIAADPSLFDTMFAALTGTIAGIVGFTLGPVGAAVSLRLATGMIAATAVWTTPAVRFLTAFEED